MDIAARKALALVKLWDKDGDQFQVLSDALEAAEREAGELREENEKLTLALRPFADVAPIFDHLSERHAELQQVCTGGITVKDLRAARAALTLEEGS